MSDLTPGPDHAIVAQSEKASFLAQVSKAFAAGIAGAVTTGGTAVASALADSNFSQGDIWLVLGAVVGGFAVGFGATYAAPANKA